LSDFLVNAAEAAVAHDHDMTGIADVCADSIDESIDVIFDGRSG
jgi:hypothetical protein